MVDVEDNVHAVVDLIAHPVLHSARPPVTVEGDAQGRPDSARLGDQRTGDELPGGEGSGGREAGPSGLVSRQETG
jgi:hypothetical protein